MVNRSCTTCVYAWWEPGQWLASLSLGFPSQPVCANHPDSPGRMKAVPYGGPCRNFRLKPATPEGEVKRIALGGGLYAYVDAADYERLSQYNWSYRAGYAGCCIKGKSVLMHRLIMNTPKGKVVDHMDGNRLNNCRANMRNCTPGENRCNQAKRIGSVSRYKGVFYLKRTGRYYAKIRHRGKEYWLGCSDDEVEAARAYDRKAVELFGEFARLNFPEEWPAERRQEVYGNRQEPTAKRKGRATKTKAGRTPRRAKASARKSRKRLARKERAGKPRQEGPNRGEM